MAESAQPSRKRRLQETAVALPALGAVFVGLPILWGGGDESNAVATSNAAIYLFSVWVGMIVLAFALSWAFRRPKAED